MLSKSLQCVFTKFILKNQNIKTFRYVRSIARRGDGPKLIDGKVKTIEDYQEYNRIETYKDLVKSIKESKLGDELEIEKHFLHEDYHGDVMEKCDMYYDMHLSEEKRLKSCIKKNIIGRKYFKLDRETNLLTYAAKEQIRFLHKSNPLEWNCKALSECFPTTEAGIKKLLKCNFVLTCPEKIRAHDENVARKWKILKSGKVSEEISPLTQKLYREGKLVDDYFSGNPNLPTTPAPAKKVVQLQKKERIGEFSAIVQTYEHGNQNLSVNKESAEKQVALRNTYNVGYSIKNSSHTKNPRRFKIATEEYDDDDDDPEVYTTRRKEIMNERDIPFSQFKENLKEKTEVNLKSKYKNEYDNFVKQQISKSDQSIKKMPQDDQNCFIKIPKHKKENVNFMYEKTPQFNRIYKYDEKLGYQYPVGKNIKDKINFSSKKRKGKLQKIGQCIYDEDGEFLYKIST